MYDPYNGKGKGKNMWGTPRAYAEDKERFIKQGMRGRMGLTKTEATRVWHIKNLGSIEAYHTWAQWSKGFGRPLKKASKVKSFKPEPKRRRSMRV